MHTFCLLRSFLEKKLFYSRLFTYSSILVKTRRCALFYIGNAYSQKTRTVPTVNGLDLFFNELCKSTKNHTIIGTSVYEELRKTLLSSCERNVLKRISEVLHDIVKIKLELEELEQLITDSSNDKELVSAAANEQGKSQEILNTLEDEFLELLSRGIRNEADVTDVILELSAGVGGQEAMLFTKEMFDMYQNYARWKRWNCEVLEYNSTDLGGLHKATLSIAGQDAGRYLKFEGGVHKVVRVPKTERYGRLHTSTMTVAVLPQSKEIEVSLKPNELKFTTKNASGPGGQHVNKTESCVRIVHIPTGITAECQIDRSQQRNREYALKTLSARLYQRELEQRLTQERSARKSQVGKAGRSERVRTYHYVQGRITDHRFGLDYYNVEKFMAGQDKMDDLISDMLQKGNLEMLQEFFRRYVYR